MKKLDPLVGKQFFEKSQLLNLLPESSKEYLTTLLRLKHYSPREQILGEGEESDAIYFIERGEVEVVRESIAGEPVIVARLKEGNVVGEMGVLDGGLRSASVYAVRDVYSWRLHRDDFLEVLHQSKEAMMGILVALCGRIRESNQRLYILSRSRVEKQLASYLLYLYKEEGALLQGQRASNKDFAEYLGVSRETISRSLKKLETLGAIRKKRQKLEILAPELLEQIEQE